MNLESSCFYSTGQCLPGLYNFIRQDMGSYRRGYNDPCSKNTLENFNNLYDLGGRPFQAATCIDATAPTGPTDGFEFSLDALQGRLREAIRRRSVDPARGNHYNVREPTAVTGVRGRSGARGPASLLLGPMFPLTAAPGDLDILLLDVAFPGEIPEPEVQIALARTSPGTGGFVRIALDQTVLWEGHLADLPRDEAVAALLPAAALQGVAGTLSFHLQSTGATAVSLVVASPVDLEEVLPGDLPRASNVEALAGDGVAGFSGDGGPANQARVNAPRGVAVGPEGHVYFSDSGNHRIRRIEAGTGIVSTVAGTGSPGWSGDDDPPSSEQLHSPAGLTLDLQGRLLVADAGNHRVRRIDFELDTIETVAGTGAAGFAGNDGPATLAELSGPTDVEVLIDGSVLVVDAGNHSVRRIDGTTGFLTQLAGTGVRGTPPAEQSPATGSPLDGPSGVTAFGDTAYVAQTGTHHLRRLDMAAETSARFAGHWAAGYDGDLGEILEASFRSPAAIAVDCEHALWIADRDNHALRRIDLASGLVETVAGQGLPWDPAGPAHSAGLRLAAPTDVALLGDGAVVVADGAGHRILRVEPVVADLAVGLSGLPSLIRPEDSLPLVMSVGNQGPEPARRARASIFAGPGLLGSDFQPSQGSCWGSSPVVCELGTIGPASEATIGFTLAVDLPEIEVALVSLQVSAAESDLALDDNLLERQIRIFTGLFADGFESGDTSAW